MSNYDISNNTEVLFNYDELPISDNTLPTTDTLLYPHEDKRGYVKVFRNINKEWVQYGETIQNADMICGNTNYIDKNRYASLYYLFMYNVS